MWDLNLPRAIAVLPTGHTAIISPLCATSAALTLLGLVLHHLPLIQGMVEAEIHRLQQQEHGSNHTTVDSHYHHGWLQGLGLEKEGEVNLYRVSDIVEDDADCAHISNIVPFLLYFMFISFIYLKGQGVVLYSHIIITDKFVLWLFLLFLKMT